MLFVPGFTLVSYNISHFSSTLSEVEPTFSFSQPSLSTSHHCHLLFSLHHQLSKNNNHIMANTANLLCLLLELMLHISSHLTTHELACFRLTCKQVETNLFESFAYEFFTKHQLMLEEVSIQALVGISNHKTLAPYLRGKVSPTGNTGQGRPLTNSSRGYHPH
jgi:hypothetical protein